MKREAKQLLSLLCLLLAPALAFGQGDPMAGQGKITLCAACHGQSGLSIAPNFANLAGQSENYLYKQLQDIKAGDRVIIEMVGQLDAFNDQDLRDIAAYYASQPAQTTGAQLIADEAWNLSGEEFLALGERIYRSGNLESGVPACTGCHSPTGQGNDPAGFPRLGGQHAIYIQNQLNNFRHNLRTNDGDTQMMRGAVEYMTDLEVRAVSNYIAGLTP